jgi:hypothetical protein
MGPQDAERPVELSPNSALSGFTRNWPNAIAITGASAHAMPATDI